MAPGRVGRTARLGGVDSGIWVAAMVSRRDIARHAEVARQGIANSRRAPESVAGGSVASRSPFPSRRVQPRQDAQRIVAVDRLQRRRNWRRRAHMLRAGEVVPTMICDTGTSFAEAPIVTALESCAVS